MRKRKVLYIIDVGRGRGKYKTRYVSTTHGRACLLYSGINIGNGYKKRLRLTFDALLQGSDRFEWLPQSITLTTYQS